MNQSNCFEASPSAKGVAITNRAIGCVSDLVSIYDDIFMQQMDVDVGEG